MSWVIPTGIAGEGAGLKGDVFIAVTAQACHGNKYAGTPKGISVAADEEALRTGRVG